MKVTVHLTRGSVTIDKVSDPNVMDLVEEFTLGDDSVMQFALDDESTTHIARRHIVRIDVDPEGEP